MIKRLFVLSLRSHIKDKCYLNNVMGEYHGVPVTYPFNKKQLSSTTCIEFSHDLFYISAANL
jgi:hypothetical protein